MNPRTLNYLGTLSGKLSKPTYGTKERCTNHRQCRLMRWIAHFSLRRSRRAIVSLLLYVAEQCNRYFARDSIGGMLQTFIPLLTRDVSAALESINYISNHIQTYTAMIPVMTSGLKDRMIFISRRVR